MEKETGMIAINKPKNENYHFVFVSGECHSQPSITIDGGWGWACTDIPWTSERRPHSPLLPTFSTSV